MWRITLRPATGTRRLPQVCWGLLLTALMSSVLAAERTELRVYGSIELDELDEWTSAFEQANPEIKLTIVRGSTGVLTARILAESATPQADVIWRLADSSLIQFERRGMLEAYAPKGLEVIATGFRPRSSPPMWVGHVGYMGVVCVNTTEMRRLGLGAIQSWRDILEPKLKGRVVMPSPASSGTGLLHAMSWLTLFGETEGAEFAKALNANIAYYTTSGSKPCSMVASGEFPVGLSFSTRAAALKAQGAPIDLVFPREGVGRDIEGSAILKGTSKLRAAQRFMDWVIGPQAMRLYGVRYPLLGSGEANAPPFHPASPQSLVVPIDSYFVATERDTVIRRWEQIAASKTEP